MMSERWKRRVEKLAAEIGTTYRDGSSSKPGHTYHPIYFEGYDIPAQSAECVKEYGAMVAAVDFTGKTALDLGCNCGYFCFRLAYETNCGEITGIESDTRNVRLMRALCEHHRIHKVRPLLFDIVGGSPWSADVVIFINTHHWIVKQAGMERATLMLRNLVAKDLFFQTAHAQSGAKFKVMELADDAAIQDMLRSAGWKPRMILDNRNRYLYHCTR